MASQRCMLMAAHCLFSRSLFTRNPCVEQLCSSLLNKPSQYPLALLFRLDKHVAGVIRDLEVFLGVAQTPSQFPTGMPSLTELTDALPSFWPFASLFFPFFTTPQTRLFSLCHSIFRKLVSTGSGQFPFYRDALTCFMYLYIVTLF